MNYNQAYYAQNKEKIKDQHRQYYIANRVQILESRRVCSICKTSISYRIGEYTTGLKLDGNMEYFCFGCKDEINEYLKKTGKKREDIISRESWNDLITWSKMGKRK
jgi:hypothetical protein